MRLLLFAALLCFGCAHSRPPPIEGWRELTSTHFRLRTDLPEGAARTTLDKLETLRWWLQSAWSTGGDSPGVTQAIVLAQPAELETFTEAMGLTVTLREGSLLVTAGTDYEFGDRSPGVHVLAHEIAHELIRRRMPGAPRWFHEGLAGHLQTVSPLADGRIRFGFVWLPPDQRKAELTSSELLIPRQLMSLDAIASRSWETLDASELTDLYVSARLWVSMLRIQEAERMRGLERALATGTPWPRAWADLRSAIDLPRVHERLLRSLQAGWPPEFREVPPLPVTIGQPLTERLLPPWEVHLCLADLWALTAQTGGGEAAETRARAELEAAAAAAPSEPLPRVRLAGLERDPDRRLQLAETLVQQFPASTDARVFLARVLREVGGAPEGRHAATVAAVTAAPNSVDALTAFAIEEMRRGNGEGALRSVTRAAELEPWNPAVLVTRALVLGAIGRCEEAEDAAQQALSLLAEAPSPSQVKVLVAERDRIGRACRALPDP